MILPFEIVKALHYCKQDYFGKSFHQLGKIIVQDSSFLGHFRCGISCAVTVNHYTGEIFMNWLKYKRYKKTTQCKSSYHYIAEILPMCNLLVTTSNKQNRVKSWRDWLICIYY